MWHITLRLIPFFVPFFSLTLYSITLLTIFLLCFSVFFSFSVVLVLGSNDVSSRCDRLVAQGCLEQVTVTVTNTFVSGGTAFEGTFDPIQPSIHTVVLSHPYPTSFAPFYHLSFVPNFYPPFCSSPPPPPLVSFPMCRSPFRRFQYPTSTR